MTVLKGLEEVDLSAPDAAEKINALAKGLLDKNAELNKSLAEVKTETRQQQIGENSAAELESLRQFKVNAEIQAAKDAQDWQKADELKTARYEDELKSKAELIAEFEKDKAFCMAPVNDGGDGSGGAKTPSQNQSNNKASEDAKAKGDLSAFLTAEMSKPNE